MAVPTTDKDNVKKINWKKYGIIALVILIILIILFVVFKFII